MGVIVTLPAFKVTPNYPPYYPGFTKSPWDLHSPNLTDSSHFA